VSRDVLISYSNMLSVLVLGPDDFLSHDSHEEEKDEDGTADLNGPAVCTTPSDAVHFPAQSNADDTCASGSAVSSDADNTTESGGKKRPRSSTVAVSCPLALLLRSQADDSQSVSENRPATKPKIPNRQRKAEAKQNASVQRQNLPVRLAQTKARMLAEFGHQEQDIISVPEAFGFSLSNPDLRTVRGWSGKNMNRKERRRFQHWIDKNVAIPRMLKLGFLFVPYEQVH
jgi:hypothetical protein